MLNTAIKFRVPTYGTCEKLAWETPTNHLWAFHPINGYELHFVMQASSTGFKTAICGSQLTDFVEYDKAIFAPQFEDILAVLPTEVSVGGHTFEFGATKDCVFYESELSYDGDFSSEEAFIFDKNVSFPSRNHSAEAMAMLALFIQKSGFLLLKPDFYC